MAEPIVLSLEETPVARPAIGYAMVITAATLWAFNGTVSKVILSSGLSSLRLAEVRSSGGALLLGAALLVLRPASLRLSRGEIPFLAVFGILGLALVQWFYFLAIHRLQIGVALIIQYLAPVVVALWARFVLHRPVRRRIWLALAFALTGLALVVQAWNGLTLNAVGVGASLGAAGSYALYILMAEQRVGTRDPLSLVFWGLAFAALLWALVQPWWSFPGHLAAREVSLHGHLASFHLPVWSLMLWVVVFGTIVPFGLLVGSLHFLAATRAAIVAMLEPVLATILAYAWLAESLGSLQVFGGIVVLGAVFLAQTAR